MLAIAKIFPFSEHMYSVRHIHANFSKTFRGKAFKDQLWACSRASYRAAFEKEMEILKGTFVGAYD